MFCISLTRSLPALPAVDPAEHPDGGDEAHRGRQVGWQPARRILDPLEGQEQVDEVPAATAWNFFISDAAKSNSVKPRTLQCRPHATEVKTEED